MRMLIRIAAAALALQALGVAAQDLVVQAPDAAEFGDGSHVELVLDGQVVRAPADGSAAGPSAASAQDTPKYRIEITEPVDGAVVSDAGAVRIRATTMPELAPGDRIELLLDGMPVPANGTSLDLPLAGMARGLHLLRVMTVDATGNVGSLSASNTLYVLGDIPGISYPR